MNEFRKAIDGLPLIVKIILALPFIDGLVYGVYRICRGDTANVILGIVWIFIGATVGWIVDIVFLATEKPVWEIPPEENARHEVFEEEEKPDDKKDK